AASPGMSATASTARRRTSTCGARRPSAREVVAASPARASAQRSAPARFGSVSASTARASTAAGGCAAPPSPSTVRCRTAGAAPGEDRRVRRRGRRGGGGAAQPHVAQDVAPVVRLGGGAPQEAVEQLLLLGDALPGPRDEVGDECGGGDPRLFEGAPDLGQR